MMQAGLLVGDKQVKAMDAVARNVTSLTQIVEDILDVSRIISGKLRLDVQPVELFDAIRDAIETVRPAADAKGIRLETIVEPCAAPISGDPERIRQILWNLLSNAVKFTGRDGRVEVRLERVSSHIAVTVTDTGAGIAPEFLPHVFERFRQADGAPSRKSSGLGLGLAIVRHIVELHGGTVVAQSEGSGRGATFTVRLPLSVAARRSPPADALTAARHNFDCPPALEGMRLLVVDDDPDARQMLATLLEACKSDVRVVSSGDEALDLLATWRPDVIVSDIGMPGMDGFRFIEALRRRPASEGGQIPAIALTAHARVEHRARALHAGFSSHVPKPVEPVELFAVIASVKPRGGGR
jgi:CheY-like chemotaxis protein/two-component sensor histidine kinase